MKRLTPQEMMADVVLHLVASPSEWI